MSVATFEMVLERAEATGNSAFVKQLRDLENLFSRGFVWHEGDLEASGLFRPSTDVLVVGGDLIVNGDALSSIPGLDEAALVVLGDIRCTNFYCGYACTILCQGSLEVENLLFTALADAVLYLFGPCRTRLLYSGNGGGWLTSFHDEVQAEILDSYLEDGRTHEEHAAVQSLHKGQIAELFTDEILDWEEWDSYEAEERAEILAGGETKFDYCVVDEARLLERVESGHPILK